MCPTHTSPLDNASSVSRVEQQRYSFEAGEPVLVASGVTCTVAAGSENRGIFENLGLELFGGQIVDLLGPSGAGKSSLLTALAQLNAHASATLTLRGRDSGSYSLQQWRRLVAYVPQTSTLIGANVADAIRLPWKLKIRRDGHQRAPDDKTLAQALERVGCADIELTRPPAELSGGQAARVSLLRTLLTEPDVLLADEVDAGLDNDNASRVSHMLADAAGRGMAVCRIRHRDSDGLASRTLTLEGGRLR